MSGFHRGRSSVPEILKKDSDLVWKINLLLGIIVAFESDKISEHSKDITSNHSVSLHEL